MREWNGHETEASAGSLSQRIEYEHEQCLLFELEFLHLVRDEPDNALHAPLVLPVYVTEVALRRVTPGTR